MQPLAERLRPRSLDQYIGQKHLVGDNAVLRRAIEKRWISSMNKMGLAVLKNCRLLASSIASRTSFTPELTADN